MSVLTKNQVLNKFKIVISNKILSVDNIDKTVRLAISFAYYIIKTDSRLTIAQSSSGAAIFLP